MSNVTREELAEVLRRVRQEARARADLHGIGVSSEDVYEAIGMVIDRLSPPKVEHEAMRCSTCNEVLATHHCAPKAGPKWPKQNNVDMSGRHVEVYPAGIVAGVVGALRKFQGVYWRYHPQVNDVERCLFAECDDVLAAFDRACKGE